MSYQEGDGIHRTFSSESWRLQEIMDERKKERKKEREREKVRKRERER
jgi:hypothetical protein